MATMLQLLIASNKNPKRNLSFSQNVSNFQQNVPCIFPTQNSKASLKLPRKHFFYLPFFNSSTFLPYRYQYHSKYEIFAEQGHNQTAKREINERYNEKGKWKSVERKKVNKFNHPAKKSGKILQSLMKRLNLPRWRNDFNNQ